MPKIRHGYIFSLERTEAMVRLLSLTQVVDLMEPIFMESTRSKKETDHDA